MAILLKYIEDVAFELNRQAAIYLPGDVKAALRSAYERETNEISKLSLRMALENLVIAEERQIPVSGDTGLVRYYLKVGNEATIEGGIVGLEQSIRRATERATREIPLRANTVHPLTRQNTVTNVGFRTPCLDYAFEPNLDSIEITVVQKGGIFGTDYRMLMPSESVDGIRSFFLDTVCEFNRRGLVCGPVVIGIGIGGTKDQCMRIGKEAAVLRLIGERHPDPEVAERELEFLKLANDIGFGIMGTNGDILATDVHVELAHTAVNTLPVAIHHQDGPFRRASARITRDNEVEKLAAPNWFTPYLREGLVKE